MERRHLVVPLDDAPSLEIRHFCDSGMKCFGEHDLFQQLASFLHRNTAVKLYSSGKTFKSLVKRTFSGLLLRLAMTSLFEEQGVGKLPYFDEIDRSSGRTSRSRAFSHHASPHSRVTKWFKSSSARTRCDNGVEQILRKPLEKAGLPTWYVSAHICQVVMAS